MTPHHHPPGSLMPADACRRVKARLVRAADLEPGDVVIARSGQWIVRAVSRTPVTGWVVIYVGAEPLRRVGVAPGTVVLVRA